MYDLAVIGLGPGGLEAVKEAVKRGLKVIAFEKNELGGTCLNVGCIPTKAILHCAKTYAESMRAKYLKHSELDFDWQKIIDRKNEIISKFTKPLNMTLSKKITLVKAEAELIIDNGIKIKAQNELYEAKNIIIATGSKPFELPNLPFDHKFILNSDDILSLPKLPKSIAIVGSGAIGAEWANILSLFNVEVKLIEKAPSLAPLFDIDIQKRIERIFKLNKIEFYKDDYIVNLEGSDIELASGKSFSVDCILSAVGRAVVLPKITKDGTDYKLQKIENNRTEFDNLFVIGDSTKGVMLAHNASFEAHKLISDIIDNKKVSNKHIPKVMYLTPEIASIGVNEQELENKDYTVKKLLLGSIAKSWCDDSSDGFIKLILKDDLIMGAHIVAPEASSLIMILAFIIENKIKKQDVCDMIFCHPSYSELILEALNND